MLNFITWNPDPVALSLGPVEIRWYGIIYALGFFLAITIIDKIFKKTILSLHLSGKVNSIIFGSREERIEEFVKHYQEKMVKKSFND